jgi:hypothetical protein
MTAPLPITTESLGQPVRVSSLARLLLDLRRPALRVVEPPPREHDNTPSRPSSRRPVPAVDPATT